MTTGQFREVDHDLLADYVGGALDGTPEHATVARLVAEDPAWAAAHAVLAPAVARVGEDLAGWGEPAPVMPELVVDRITAALAGAGPAAPAHVPVQPTGPRTVVPRTGERPATTGRGRRRWSRRAAPVLVAAAAVAVTGLGVTQLVTGQDGAGDAASNTLGGDAAAAGGFRLDAEPRRTGLDYTPELLAPTASEARPFSSSDERVPAVGAESQDAGRVSAAGAGLDRLTDPAALNSCLAEISAEHARGPLTVDRVEYAAFRGAPALVVGFVDADGGRWVWTTGGECGVPGSGADTRYRARVG